MTSVLTALCATSILIAATPVPVTKPAVPDTPADVAAPPADAQRTPSGLASKVLRKGSGSEQEHPRPADKITVHYAGWTTDGVLFASSYGGTPVTYPLNRMIPGWIEGLQLMVPGEKRRFWIPEQMAYAGRPGRPQGMLVFDVELLSFHD